MKVGVLSAQAATIGLIFHQSACPSAPPPACLPAVTGRQDYRRRAHRRHTSRRAQWNGRGMGLGAARVLCLWRCLAFKSTFWGSACWCLYGALWCSAALRCCVGHQCMAEHGQVEHEAGHVHSPAGDRKEAPRRCIQPRSAVRYPWSWE